jgi:protein gp37
MGKTTISWTNYSWNPWRGCHKVSQGCARCYMFREQKRYGRDPNIVMRSKTTFNDPLKWKEPAMVFTCSWSDFFIEEADPWRDEAWEIIRQTPHLTYQILTKRPENIQSRLPEYWLWLENVWLGVSIEDQKHIDRGWTLLHVPARVRFISAEPLIDSLDLFWLLATQKFHWVIVGGESGPGCRPMDLEWARNIRDECAKDDGIVFFMKQIGGHPDRREDIDQFPDDLRIQEFPTLEPQKQVLEAKNR